MDEEIGPHCSGPLQRKKTRVNGWTKARRGAFVEELAMTCNVRRAHAAAEMGPGSAYRLRRRDPYFARQWQDALELGYERLELALVRRALEAVDEISLDETREPVVKMTVAEATALLRLHRVSVGRGQANGRRLQAREVATQQEVDAILLKRIQMARRRLRPPAADEGPAPSPAADGDA